MIILFSSIYDFSSNEVIDWLNYYKVKWYRINGESLDELNNKYSISIIERQILCNNQELNFCSPVSLWYRRSHSLKKYRDEILNNRLLNNKASINLYNHLKNEVFRVYSYFMNSFGDNWLDHPKIVSECSNKLYILTKAVEMGLNIPNTLITNSRQEALNFTLKHEKVITKPVTEVEIFSIDNYVYMTYTQIINEETINNSTDTNDLIFPSLLQQYVEKELEIRIFYFFGQFYSMAIFSQLDKQTQIDFRNYNYTNWNRMVPYQLTRETEMKIIAFMDGINLNNGSIDMIKDKNGIFYFLEVNPIGQFGMVSYPCNYFLEDVIAKKLIENESKN